MPPRDGRDALIQPELLDRPERRIDGEDKTTGAARYTADLVVPRTERGYHPLSAVYTRACLEPLARRLAARQLTMRLLLDDVRVRVVTADEIEKFGDRHRLLANVNTPAEYAGLEALQGHKL